MRRTFLKMLDKVRNALENAANLRQYHKKQVAFIERQFEEQKFIIGKLLSEIMTKKPSSTPLKEVEFKIFSQWGEDGILQFLLAHLQIKEQVFVEFGVENYKEANTRFLLMNNNWSGLVLDSNENHIASIKKDPIYWRYNLKAASAFITRDNINPLLLDNGIQGEIGLLSIDIDGNDYWVWEAITCISPAIVIIEYNSRFGAEKAVTIPYQENFTRVQAHYSMLYYGASLRALYLLGQKKGYTFVGCNSAGNNAFFVRRDLMPDTLKSQTVKDGFVAGQFREARDEQRQLVFLSQEEEQKILMHLPVISVE